MRFKRFAFLHIEKCGGTTLVHLLRSSFGHRHFDLIATNNHTEYAERDDFKRVFRLCPSAVSLAGHCIRLHSDAGLSHSIGTGFYTILREPVSRYISEFKHLSPCFKGVNNFETWLRISERHNYMTRVIAGEPNLNKAIDILHERMVLVGVLDDYGTFLRQLRLLFYPQIISGRYEIRNRASNRYEGLVNGLYGRITRINTHTDIDFQFDEDAYRDDVAEKNAIDIRLYTYVRNVLLPDQQKRFDRYANEIDFAPPKEPAPLKLSLQLTINRLYRNGLYKPLLGLLPVPYKMERYRNV